MRMRDLALASAAFVALTVAGAAPAAATIVCNGSGDCWHTDSRYDYDRSLKVRTYPDDWYFHRHWTDSDREYRWRAYHEGRGYYRGDVWVTF